MLEKQKKQCSKNDRDDSLVNNQKTTLVLLKDNPRKNIDETINTPERYVSWFQASTSNLDKYLEQWKKEKKMPKDVMLQILNLALTKCNIESLKISQQFNLPPPIPLPKINMDEKAAQSYIG